MSEQSPSSPSQPSQQRAHSRLTWLAMKEKVGLATEVEVRELAAAPVFVGPTGQLVVPRPCATAKEWVARYGGRRASYSVE